MAQWQLPSCNSEVINSLAMRCLLEFIDGDENHLKSCGQNIYSDRWPDKDMQRPQPRLNWVKSDRQWYLSLPPFVSSQRGTSTPLSFPENKRLGITTRWCHQSETDSWYGNSERCGLAKGFAFPFYTSTDWTAFATNQLFKSFAKFMTWTWFSK